MKAILSVGPNYEIGYTDGRLIYEDAHDKRFFRAMTISGTVIAGGATAKTLPHGLPRRRCLCLCSCLPPAGWDRLDGDPPQDAWVIGGSRTLDYFIPLIDELFLSQFEENVQQKDVIRLSPTAQSIIRGTTRVKVAEYPRFTVWKYEI